MIQDGWARMTAPFRRLSWKMTLSYTAVTVSALVALEFLIIAGGLITVARFFRSPLLARGIEQSYGRTLVNTLHPHLAATPPDVEALQTALERYGGEDTQFTLDSGWVPGTDTAEPPEMLLIGQDGIILAVTGPRFNEALGQPYTGLQATIFRPLIEAALDGAPLTRRYTFDAGQLFLVTPILNGEEGELLGAVGWTTPIPTVDQGILKDLVPLVVISLGVFTLGTGAIGTLFGFLTSRSLVRRFDHLASVAGDWSQGDFTSFAQDEGGDELADLSRRMNRMAEQIQNLLEERDRLAAVQERNRIARDLHDSVKQQAFAAAGQIGAAKALLAHDHKAAAEHIDEAEALIYSLRQELTLLIEELRPVALEKQGLGAALQAYLQRWSRRTEIDVNTRIADEIPLSLDAEQTLFRIVQEALANVARHSQATCVQLSLTRNHGAITLTVRDDGIGFAPEHVTAGFGLSSIRQRAVSLPGGSLALDSAPGAGTTLEVRTEASPPTPEGR